MPETLVPWYADDSGAVGKAADTARGLKFLQEEGPKYGYHPEPAKCTYVCKAKDPFPTNNDGSSQPHHTSSKPTTLKPTQSPTANPTQTPTSLPMSLQLQQISLQQINQLVIRRAHQQAYDW
jgi:hypothetical protein